MTKDSNIILIGNNPRMDYVLAIMTLLHSDRTKQIIIKSKGRKVSKAVDVAEIIKRRYEKNLKIKDISIGTDKILSQEGKPKFISTMEIVLTKAD